MTDKDIKDYCKNCDVEPPAMRFKCPECEHNPNNENNFAKDINVPHKEQIIIDGVTYYKQQDINKGLDEEHYITEFHLLATHYNLLLEDYARKTQECEKIKSEARELFNTKLELLRELDHYKRAYYGCAKRIKEHLVLPAPLPPPEFVDDRYRKALEEIKKVCIEDVHTFADGTELRYDSLDKILDIINKAKGRIDD